MAVSSRRPNHARARKPSQKGAFGGRRTSGQHAAGSAAQAPGAAELQRSAVQGRLRGAGALASLASPPARAAPSGNNGSRERMPRERSDSPRPALGARQTSRRRFPERVSPAVRRGHGIGSPTDLPGTDTPPEELGFSSPVRPAAGSASSRCRCRCRRCGPAHLGHGERGGGPAPPAPRCARPAAEPRRQRRARPGAAGPQRRPQPRHGRAGTESGARTPPAPVPVPAAAAAPR